MTSKIVDRELEIYEEMVHVEFPRGDIKTFVWLANHDDLSYHEEFMKKFFESMDEYAIKVEFDLYKDMVAPFIDNYRSDFSSNQITCNKSDEHLFFALKNKLQQCLNALNKVQFIERT